ncbi:IclR family transcriptional regulator [Pseudorhodoplanes sp.]|uniref:IclR family transcriptional regulator n=1 Tax=Pseudorhodoplanes sp. TaxID=1934341 RepID=UPI003D0F56E7
MAAQRKGIQSVEQGVKLLEILIAARQALPLRTLAQSSGMSPSMAHRYLASFIRADLVCQDAASGYYDLGTLALRLGMAALNRADLVQIADDEFRQLVARVNVDGHLSVWGDYGVTIVRIHDSHVPILSNLRLGAVLPLYDSAAGRIFLAFQSQPTIKSVLRSELAQREERRPSSKEVAAAAHQVRCEGFAWIDGQVFHGIRAIAAPIFDPQGSLRAAMSLVSNQPSLVDFPNPIMDDLRDTAKRVSHRLGWQGA